MITLGIRPPKFELNYFRHKNIFRSQRYVFAPVELLSIITKHMQHKPTSQRSTQRDYCAKLEKSSFFDTFGDFDGILVHG